MYLFMFGIRPVDCAGSRCVSGDCRENAARLCLLWYAGRAGGASRKGQELQQRDCDFQAAVVISVH